MFRILTFLLISFLFCSATAQNKRISLAGKWQAVLDTQNETGIENTLHFKPHGTINLPGSLAEYGLGYKTKGSDFGILTPEYKYIGKARYSRQITIPERWKDKETELLLERVLWESRVFIDGKEISRRDALGTPHIHSLGKIEPGNHELSILVNNDMVHNIGDKGHAYGGYTQSIWNGIVGKIELRAKDETHLIETQIFSDIQKNQLQIKSSIQSKTAQTAKFKYEILSIKNAAVVLSGNFKQKLERGKNDVEQVILTRNKLEKWSEFNPEVYSFKLYMEAGKSHDSEETEFGYCKISHNGTKIVLNGTPVFLRGNLDCVHFPLTGYVSCNLEDWINIFETYKAYGLNHARFHSWCPPEAAFKAANRVGIYLQAEASIWIDWWMSTNMIERGRPEMDTKGYPKGLGYDAERDKFVIAEMNRVVATYGNHPSFALFCIGNELGNSDFDTMKQWVADLKEKDPRRLYAVSTARTITDIDDYSATHYIQDVGRTRGLNGAHTNWNFEKVYSKMDIPIIAHEIGQWPVYPRWNEIKKYNGVLKARNLEKFKSQAQKNGIADQDNAFADASGALNQLLYKYEIESFLRTESCAGIQLLSMQDYQGQGEALIGWLDSHWESKNITSPEIFRKHSNTTVPLLLFDKYVWENNETFTAEIQLSHHADTDLTGTVYWKTWDDTQIEIAKGNFEKVSFKNATLTSVGTIELDLSSITTATKLKIEVGIAETQFLNDWEIWVYPKDIRMPDSSNIFIVDKLESKTLEKLRSGAKVLLKAHDLGTEETSVNALFYPLYWSLTFFPGQGKTNIGLLLQENHPAFKRFPTSFHSNWQWETLSSDAKGFIINDLPHNYKALAQPVDDFHRNNKVGSIFELKVGEGKLLVCGYNLNSGYPVARQLKFSLLNYMNSDAFNPSQTVEENWLSSTFKSIPEVKSVKLPEEFSNAILIVDAAENLEIKNKSCPWKPEFDQVEIAENAEYKLKLDGIWKDSRTSAWHGKEMEIQIDCPEGMLGTLLINFTDHNNNGRSGILEFEGRRSKLGLHRGEGIWVEFHVMREDSNDGKLILKTKTKTGPNLMISKMVFLKE